MADTKEPVDWPPGPVAPNDGPWFDPEQREVNIGLPPWNGFDPVQHEVNISYVEPRGEIFRIGPKLHTGVLFTADWSKQTLEQRLDNIFGPFELIVLDMPCGYRGGFTRAGFPSEDVACPCGQDNCWVVKYD